MQDWKRLKIPILNDAGESAWPERYSLEKIKSLRRRSGPNKFASQMMLEPVSVTESRLDTKRIKFYGGSLDYREVNGCGVLSLNDKRLVGVSCWWDPSFGSPSGDKSVVAVAFFDEVGNAYLHRLLYLTVPPNEEATAYQCQAVRKLIQDTFVTAIHVESNGIGKFLPALLRQEFARSRTRCAVIEETSRLSKSDRILSAFDAMLMNGSFWAHEDIRKTPFLDEMRDFIPQGKAHDDSLDAVAGCLLAEPVRLERIPPTFIKNTLEWRF